MQFVILMTISTPLKALASMAVNQEDDLNISGRAEAKESLHIIGIREWSQIHGKEILSPLG